MCAAPITTITAAPTRALLLQVTAPPSSTFAPSRWAMETPEILESTPLLRSPLVPLPCIRPVIDRLLAQSNTTPTEDHILAQFPSQRDLTPSYRTAFVLITLFQIGSDARKHSTRGGSLSLWDEWDHQVNAELVAEHCSSHILEVWSNFLRVPRSNASLDALLWTVLPLEEDRYAGVCRTFYPLARIFFLEKTHHSSQSPISFVKTLEKGYLYTR